MDRILAFTCMWIIILVIRLESPVDINPKDVIWWFWLFGLTGLGAGLGISIYRFVKQRLMK